MTIVYFSFFINVIIAGFFGASLSLGLFNDITKVYGVNTPARQILSCVYLAIAIVSLWAILNSTYIIMVAEVLFPLQIIYKILTIIVVTDRTNPVPRANLLISLIHCVSLFYIWSR